MLILIFAALALAPAVRPPASSRPSRIPPARHVRPVLAFPEPGLDDSAAYAGYQTRLFRDAALNTVQVYLDAPSGRVVQLWADAEDESVGFTARDASGRPAALRWGSDGATVNRSGRTRVVTYALTAPGTQVTLGAFLLGSMRVERDFQYASRQRAPFAEVPFRVAELDRMLDAMGRVPAEDQRRALADLHASSLDELRSRLRPRVSAVDGGDSHTVRVVQPSLDALDTLTLEFQLPRGSGDVDVTPDSVILRRRGSGPLIFDVRTTTTGRTLTPLSREQIFTPAFLAFIANAHARAARDPGSAAGLRARRLERQVAGVELLSSREKLMAGLPTYATYFGRDPLMSALMMAPIWRGAMAQAVINGVLRKLGPNGEVSHEEALGGQAVREGAGEYATLVDSVIAARASGDEASAVRLRLRADQVVRSLRRTRENYRMLDDKFQFPVLVARWLDDPTVTAASKRSFLLDSSDGGGTRVARLLRELALVARLTAPYAANPDVSNLVSFRKVDTVWQSASWRDSGEGYAGGRYAMDINAIWAPHALEATGRILGSLNSLGIPAAGVAGPRALTAAGTPLGNWIHDPGALRGATAEWQRAERHFVVQLPPSTVHADVMARLAAMPAAERQYWTQVLVATGADRDSLTFLALSLDATGHPIGVANTDPGTRLFLGEHEGPQAIDDGAERARVLRDVRVFERAYPVGLLIDNVGPVVANDAYASPAIWSMFVRDTYHGPRVVWGREVNLFLLGVANRLGTADGDAAYKAQLRRAAATIRKAVGASGFHSELWSYEIVNGRLVPMRYGSGADVQLWSTTDLAVEYVLSRLGL